MKFACDVGGRVDDDDEAQYRHCYQRVNCDVDSDVEQVVDYSARDLAEWPRSGRVFDRCERHTNDKERQVSDSQVRSKITLPYLAVKVNSATARSVSK